MQEVAALARPMRSSVKLAWRLKLRPLAMIRRFR